MTGVVIQVVEGLVIGGVCVAWIGEMLHLERRTAALNELRRVKALGAVFRETLPRGSIERVAVSEAFLSLDVEGATGEWSPPVPVREKPQ